MMELTADAQRMLDDYLRRADTHLRGASVGDAEEVEHELRAHVERELQEVPQPVSSRDMQAVLERLGSPADLVPEEELSWWRRAALRWQTGPEDWRLAYLSIGIFSLGLLLHGTPIGGLGVLVSFFLSRASLAVTEDEEDLGPKKWLIYPGLILVYLPLALFMLLWPLVFWEPLVALSWKIHLFSDRLHGSPSPLLLVLPVWWLVLIGLSRCYPNFLPSLFRPFVTAPGTRLLSRVVLGGLLVLLLSFAGYAWQGLFRL